MDVFQIDPLTDPRWSSLVERHVRGSVFHSAQWLAALQKTYGYEPVVISTSSPAQEISNGLVVCRIKSWLTGNRLVSLPFSDHCDPLVENPEELETLLLHLKTSVDKGEWKYMEVRPTRFDGDLRHIVNKNTTYYFHRLALSKDLDAIFKGFHKDCVQRKIRRAERESLRYEEGTSPELLKHFYALLVATRRRQLLPPQPLDWFLSLIGVFGDELKIRVAFKGSIPIASILTLSHKKTMTYKYGCSDTDFNNLGGTALLFWKMIQEAKNNGFEEVDMGRSDMENMGLVTFKEHWGATRSEIDYWRYPTATLRHSSHWPTRLGQKIVPLVPDMSLVAVGNLLYRHIG
jgi:CelD/BcsL family acetyltransferase involved in cellulose biosynthesis